MPSNSPLTLKPAPKSWASRYAMVTGSVGGLLLGLLAGMASHGRDTGVLHTLSPYINGIGTFWMNALSAIVIPLLVTNVIAAVLRGRNARQSGVLSAQAFVLFCVWLTIGALLTLAVVPVVLSMMPIDAATTTGMLNSLPADALAAAQARPAPSTPGEVVAMFMPRNLLKAAMNEEVLPLLIASIAFAFAVVRTSTDARDLITRVFLAMSETLLVLIGWLVAVMPLGAFCLAFTFTKSAGLGVAGILGQYTLITSAALLLLTIVLYPLTWLVARVPMRQFAAAVLPAQISAISTRSSLASLPALLEGGIGKLGLRPDVANLALPLSVAIFKINRTTSSLVKMLFLAYMFNIDLSVLQIIAFTLTMIILSFTGLGIPGGGGAWKSTAAYLALGLPLEGYVLLGATDAIVDIFKTVLNVTGDMSVAAVLDRRSKAVSPAISDPGEGSFEPVAA